ncbi:hypothetical protein K435DRAFT_214148 [Dendrothele bispora CBS 962.96]|uniref:Protein N-terminal glutamine amidohydrolase n=1 Tax=Dendrothele bispora (strain CBS 962.96) TaxID=1314807 RepID=A0A4S8LRS9_DENBC|nr:hypothetical protein K435DRAFT_214148 [Dendrothele bispora CBS 962.96]
MGTLCCLYIQPNPNGASPQILPALNAHTTSEASNWVYDFDTQLGTPFPLQEYFACTFSLGLPVQYQSLFRVVPGVIYMDNLASDRSHMSSSNKPPPSYPPLRGKNAIELGVTHNLVHYISMTTTSPTSLDGEIYGDVMDLYRVLTFFTGQK